MAGPHRALFTAAFLLSPAVLPVRGEPNGYDGGIPPTAVRARRPAAKEAAPVVRHFDGRCADGWYVAETPNFRIFHRGNRELVEKAARIAEQTRAAVLPRWFGEKNEDWGWRCDLYLHASREAYRDCTGMPAASAGHTTIATADGGRLRRRVDVRCDYAGVLTAVLPHEITHAVLAGKFGNRRVPPWVDEGVAVLTEPEERVNCHLRDLPHYRGERKLFDVRELMELRGYPPPEQTGVFYAQSVSLVRFLSREKGPQVFTRFVRDGAEEGYAKALKNHYGLGFAELEERWARQEFGAPVAAADGVRRGD